MVLIFILNGVTLKTSNYLRSDRYIVVQWYCVICSDKSSDTMASTRLNLELLVGLLFAVLCFSGHNKADDVILTPLFGSSHYFVFKRIGEELANRGYNVRLSLI